MTQEELKKAIAEGKGGVYVFIGEEEYLKRHYLSEFKKAILDGEPTFAAFNHQSFEGREIDFAALREAIMTPPMMAERKLCEWHLCDFNAMRDKTQKELLETFSLVEEYPYATVVFSVQPEDFDAGFLPKKPSKLYTLVSKNAEIIDFPKSTDRQLSSWIGRHFVRDGISYPPSFPEKLIERCGHGMDVLKSEMEKLVIFAKASGKDAVDFDDLENVTCTTSESDAFALSNAILEGNVDGAYRALYDMKSRRVEPIVILGAVTSAYSDLLAVAKMAADGTSQAEIGKRLRIHEYKAGLYMKSARRRRIEALEETLTACRAADLRAKTGFGIGYGLIERLIAECATKR